MDNIMREVQLRMELLGNNELRFGLNHPGNDKLQIVRETIKSLEDYAKRLEEHPEDYEEKDKNAEFKLSLELLKINR